jgi:hypothetical protein
LILSYKNVALKNDLTFWYVFAEKISKIRGKCPFSALGTVFAKKKLEE